MTDDEISAVETDLLSLLVTNWGERLMRYSFGANLIEFLFEPRTDGMKSRIADRINQQVGTWLPFLALDTLNIFFEGEIPEVPENGIGISMEYRLKSKPDLRSRSTFIIKN